MIPWVAPPLLGLSVLVTRPRGQGTALCQHINRLGGEAIEFPALDIEPLLDVVAPAGGYDLVLFLSANAVRHGITVTRTLLDGGGTRIGALGNASVAALAAAGVTADVVPETGTRSEDLLAHPVLRAPIQRVLLVRGVGGRELLPESLSAAGTQVDVLEVYRRRPAVHGADDVAALENCWREQGVGIVTATSVDTLQALLQILTPGGVELLRHTPLLVVSDRVRDAAVHHELRGECVLAPRAEDAALLGTLATWRTRAR